MVAAAAVYHAANRKANQVASAGGRRQPGSHRCRAWGDIDAGQVAKRRVVSASALSIKNDAVKPGRGSTTSAIIRKCTQKLLTALYIEICE